MAKADDTLPFILNILLAHSASLLGLLLVMCITSPSLLLLLLPLGLIYRQALLVALQTWCHWQGLLNPRFRGGPPAIFCMAYLSA